MPCRLSAARFGEAHEEDQRRGRDRPEERPRGVQSEGEAMEQPAQEVSRGRHRLFQQRRIRLRPGRLPLALAECGKR